jgi:hypothetical protein
MSKFWDKLSEGLAEVWITKLIFPPFIFICVGWLAWVTRDSGFAQFIAIISRMGDIEGIVAILLGLWWIVLTDKLVDWLTLPTLRVFEGYWPWVFKNLSYFCSKYVAKIIQTKQNKRNELASHFEKLTRGEYDQYVGLDTDLATLPKKSFRVMPTLLGNILRSAEEYPYIRYGLEIHVTWPRIWLLLPDAAQKELSQARQSLNDNARLMIWAIALSFWAAVSIGIWGFSFQISSLLQAIWPILLSVIACFYAYHRMVDAAGVYGELIRAAYDNYRFILYQSLHWKLPSSTDSEEASGLCLTEYLHRGVLTTPIHFDM